MTTVVSRHDSDLVLPIGGARLRPGIPVRVDRWEVIKGHPVVAAWLRARAIEEVEAGDVPVQARPDDGALDDMRARYEEKIGVAPDRRWGLSRLQTEIDKAAED